MKPTLRLILVMMVMMMLAVTAASEPWNVTNLTASNATTQGIYPVDTNSNVLGGAATQVDLRILTQSLRWQAYYGDVFNHVVLSDGTNLFYDWSNADPEGEIFATRTTSLDWSQIACATYDTIIAEQVITGDGSDRVNLTFSAANVKSFKVGDASFNAGACKYATFTIDSTGEQGTYEEVLLETQGDIVYTAIVAAGGDSFTGQKADFQVLVAEDGTDELTTTYYFYAELS